MSASAARTQVDGRFKPCVSGNPAGRPRGAKNKATLLAEEAMEQKIGEIVEALVERALAGSAAAMRICLDRTMPAPRGCSRFELPDLRGPRGIADAQEALIMAVAAGQVPPRDAERVMALIATFKNTLLTEAHQARMAALEAERRQPAPAEIMPVPEAAPAPEPEPAQENAAIAAPDRAVHAGMDWFELIDAMWKAEEAEENAASVAAEPSPAESVPAEARAADAGDPASDGAGCPVETVRPVAALADENCDIYSEIQADDAPPGDPGALSQAVAAFDETVPPPYIDMSGQATLRRLHAARARRTDRPAGRAAGYA